MNWLLETYLAPYLPLKIWPGVELRVWLESAGPEGMMWFEQKLKLIHPWFPNWY